MKTRSLFSMLIMGITLASMVVACSRFERKETKNSTAPAKVEQNEEGEIEVTAIVTENGEVISESEAVENNEIDISKVSLTMSNLKLTDTRDLYDGRILTFKISADVILKSEDKVHKISNSDENRFDFQQNLQAIEERYPYLFYMEDSRTYNNAKFGVAIEASCVDLNCNYALFNMIFNAFENEDPSMVQVAVLIKFKESQYSGEYIGILEDSKSFLTDDRGNIQHSFDSLMDIWFEKFKLD